MEISESITTSTEGQKLRAVIITENLSDGSSVYNLEIDIFNIQSKQSQTFFLSFNNYEKALHAFNELSHSLDFKNLEEAYLYLIYPSTTARSWTHYPVHERG